MRNGGEALVREKVAALADGERRVCAQRSS
jgi:hypothetical protein